MAKSPAYKRTDIDTPEVRNVLMSTCTAIRGCGCALVGCLLVEVEKEAESSCSKGDSNDCVGRIAPDGELFLVLGEVGRTEDLFVKHPAVARDGEYDVQLRVVKSHVGVGSGGVGEKGGDLDAIDVDLREGGNKVDASGAGAGKELDALYQEKQAAVKVG